MLHISAQTMTNEVSDTQLATQVQPPVRTATYGGRMAPAGRGPGRGLRSDNSLKPLSPVQSAFGNQAVLRMLNYSGSRGVLQRKCSCEGPGSDCSSCAEEKEETLHRAANGPQPDGVPPIVHDVLRSPGQPLDAGTRAYMEPRFGYDFSGVRVHTDARAAESARAVNSLAYTSGKRIVFARGAYSPNSSEGQRLLAHELTHVIQQDGSPNTVQHHVSRPTDPAEQEADRTAAAITRSQPAPPITSAAQGIHRDAGGAGRTVPEPACSAANTSTSTHAVIYPVVVANDDGSSPTPDPPLDQVRAIWSKCCILFGSVFPSGVVRSTSLKTLPIRPPTGGSPTPEETSLFNAAGSVDGIQIICVDQFSRDGVTGKNVAGGGKTYDAGTAHPRIVIVSGISPEIVAHEVGHATGFLGHSGGDGTVMQPTSAYNVPSSTHVSPTVCTRARSGSVLDAQGTSCCMDPT